MLDCQTWLVFVCENIDTVLSVSRWVSVLSRTEQSVQIFPDVSVFNSLLLLFSALMGRTLLLAWPVVHQFRANTLPLQVLNMRLSCNLAQPVATQGNLLGFETGCGLPELKNSILVQLVEDIAEALESSSLAFTPVKY